MSGSRVPLDLELPLVVACSDLPCGAQRYKRGDVLPWRDLGLSELDVLRLWTWNQVDTKVPPPAPTPAPAPTPKPKPQPQQPRK